MNDVGCIPPQDYGNMLVFVNRGALAALARLRGRVFGSAEAILQELVFGPATGLDVKAWRNSAFTKVCGAAVPAPE